MMQERPSCRRGQNGGGGERIGGLGGEAVDALGQYGAVAAHVHALQMQARLLCRVERRKYAAFLDKHGQPVEFLAQLVALLNHSGMFAHGSRRALASGQQELRDFPHLSLHFGLVVLN